MLFGKNFLGPNSRLVMNSESKIFPLLTYLRLRIFYMVEELVTVKTSAIDQTKQKVVVTWEENEEEENGTEMSKLQVSC